MKHLMTLVIFFLISSLVCFGQGQEEKQDGNKHESDTRYVKLRSDALYIYRVGDKKSEALSYKEAMVESIKTDWIESVSVLKDPGIVYAFSALGKNAVIIITFKNIDTLPEDFQAIITTPQLK